MLPVVCMATTLFSLQLSFMQWAVVCATVFIIEFMGHVPPQCTVSREGDRDQHDHPHGHGHGLMGCQHLNYDGTELNSWNMMYIMLFVSSGKQVCHINIPQIHKFTSHQSHLTCSMVITVTVMMFQSAVVLT